MFIHPSNLTYSQTRLNVCMAQPLVGTSGRRVKQFDVVEKSIASLITGSFLSNTNDKSFRYVSLFIRR
nr:unnamed protein product [Callosobruchus analis]